MELLSSGAVAPVTNPKNGLLADFRTLTADVEPCERVAAAGVWAECLQKYDRGDDDWPESPWALELAELFTGWWGGLEPGDGNVLLPHAVAVLGTLHRAAAVPA
jgi:hypothetical protein